MASPLLFRFHVQEKSKLNWGRDVPEKSPELFGSFLEPAELNTDPANTFSTLFAAAELWGSKAHHGLQSKVLVGTLKARGKAASGLEAHKLLRIR